MGALAQALLLLAEHADLVEDIVRALAGGTPRDALKAAIKAAMVEASDAAMREELASTKGDT